MNKTAVYDKECADTTLSADESGLVTFGVPYIVNPELPEHFAQHAPCDNTDPASFYGSDARAYTDCPAMTH